jgi:hypothetical protein
MGILSRLFQQRPPSRTETAMSVHASELVEVVGESYRQEQLRQVAKLATSPAVFVEDLAGRALKRAHADPSSRWFRAALIREPDNRKDPDAIAVYADGVGRIGYLSRGDAIAYQPIFDALRQHGCDVASCPAFLLGGEIDKPSYGVMLCLSSPKKIVEDLAAPAA